MNKSGRVGTYRTMPDWGSLAFSTTYGAAAGVMEYVAEGSKVGVGKISVAGQVILGTVDIAAAARARNGDGVAIETMGLFGSTFGGALGTIGGVALAGVAGAEVGAVATSWTGPGALVGAVFGFAGGVLGGIVGEKGFEAIARGLLAYGHAPFSYPHYSWGTADKPTAIDYALYQIRSERRATLERIHRAKHGIRHAC